MLPHRQIGFVLKIRHRRQRGPQPCPKSTSRSGSD